MVNTSAGERVAVSRRICGGCWQRHLDLEPAREEERRRHGKRVDGYRRWLEKAPNRVPAAPDMTPDPVEQHWTPLATPPRPGQEPAGRPFEDLVLERTVWSGAGTEHWVMEIDVAAADLALHESRGAGQFLQGPSLDDELEVGPRRGHRDALRMLYGFDGGTRLEYRGSVFRVDSDRILVEWKLHETYDLSR
ncbi:hypothetical protein [Actinomadura miaoliensis]